MTADKTPPPDQPARDRIATALDDTLFVEAGAGSGKTTALVGRIVALIRAGDVELREIAAITFTEKAAAELRDRLRQELERTITEPVTDPAIDPATDDRADSPVGAPAGQDADLARRARLAIDQLDGAAVGTLHAFAQRVLAEHPIEAGLPPRVQVLDEVSSQVAFEQRWRSFQDELLADPAYQRSLLLLVASDIKIEALKVLAQEFERNWDLVAERVDVGAGPPAGLLALARPALALVEEALALRPICTDPTDKLAVRMEDLAAWLDGLAAVDDELDLLAALRAHPSTAVGGIGKQGSWGGDLDTVKAAVRRAGDAVDAVGQVVGAACVHHLAVALRGFTVAAAEERRARGELGFHDLLVHARTLLTSPVHGGEVRRRLHDRYRRLLLDEFQDTDPIQVELAVRIAAADPAAPETGTLPWDEVEVAPGHLFVVGDPKQSIYRFRRADISVFLAAAARFGAGGGRQVLNTNYRSVAPVIDQVNHAFATLFAEGSAVDLPVPSQAAYVPLAARNPDPGPQAGPAVSVLGRAPVVASAAELRTSEAADVAAAVLRAVDEGWWVRVKEGGHRPARLGDITILVPARTSLPFLEDALGRAGIPFRAEASSLVYASRAVRDLLMVLRAIDDPTDHLAIVSALRTPLLACGDDDLFRFKVLHGGRWDHQAPFPDGVTPGPVTEGLAYLRDRHRERFWTSPAELLDRVADDLRAFELGIAEGRPRDVWRRLRFVIDQARAWSDATGGGLRDYLRWVALQSSEGSRVSEAVLPEADDDAVRIMTIHAAKGLEFPITILSGLSAQPQTRRGLAQVAFPPDGTIGYRFGAKVTTEAFVAYNPIDEQMGLDERVRLLYVAATRAEDHLVVSLHRKVRKGAAAPHLRTNAELLADGFGARLDDPAQLPDAVDIDRPPRPAPAPAAPAEPPLIEEWRAERAAALARGSRPTTIAATALRPDGAVEPDLPAPAPAPLPADEVATETERGTETEPDVETETAPNAETAPDIEPAAGTEPGGDPAVAGLRKQPPDLDLPPWIKGRYGTAVGRAVHGVLQTIDLATGAGLAGAVAAQVQAEAVPERAADVEALVRAALSAPSVQEAARLPHWREVYACVPTPSGRLLEGYLDLLYRTDCGLVVVDHKTAGSADPDDLARRTAGYRLQGASYAWAIGEATGEPVVRVCFLYLTPAGAVEVDLEDLDAAIAEARALVDAGHEVLPPA